MGISHDEEDERGKLTDTRSDVGTKNKQSEVQNDLFCFRNYSLGLSRIQL